MTNIIIIIIIIINIIINFKERRERNSREKQLSMERKGTNTKCVRPGFQIKDRIYK